MRLRNSWRRSSISPRSSRTAPSAPVCSPALINPISSAANPVRVPCRAAESGRPADTASVIAAASRFALAPGAWASRSFNARSRGMPALINIASSRANLAREGSPMPLPISMASQLCPVDCGSDGATSSGRKPWALSFPSASVASLASIRPSIRRPAVSKAWKVYRISRWPLRRYARPRQSRSHRMLPLTARCAAGPSCLKTGQASQAPVRARAGSLQRR